MFSAKQGHYWYHFYNVFGMTRSLTGDWTRDLPHLKPPLGYRGGGIEAVNLEILLKLRLFGNGNLTHLKVHFKFTFMLIIKRLIILKLNWKQLQLNTYLQCLSTLSINTSNVFTPTYTTYRFCFTSGSCVKYL